VEARLLDEAFNRIAKLMKADRDANFVETNDKGVTSTVADHRHADVERGVERDRYCRSGGAPLGCRTRYPGEI